MNEIGGKKQAACEIVWDPNITTRHIKKYPSMWPLSNLCRNYHNKLQNESRIFRELNYEDLQ